MIGVFDSGIGGLTLLHELTRLMPNEDYIYFADTDHVPYSYRTKEEIKGFVEDAVLFLREKGCDVIVLACNTATNVAVEYLREKYDFPIVAIQPAVKVAADHSEDNKRILACATPVTLNADRYKNLVARLGIGERLDNLPLPKLVEFAEKGIFEGKEVEEYLKQEIEKLISQEHHFIVLGCTHFTFYESLIEQLFPTLQALDGNEGTARQVKRVLEKEVGLKTSGSGHTVFYESGRKVENLAKYVKLLAKLRLSS
ncbi:glutamate racemase [Jiulongibacter sediminis]|jgi:glutamate racemase|uniref:glutamate racemase n=1 Tax=Jiulongibacter sediminis TaxID=1605367 RepID=UPI0026EF5E99|nr:glutamate racemase [Jiulongibacter sediminis]